SPMSFSPTGDLAFVVMDPYPETKRASDVDRFALTGASVNRLMVLTKDKKLSEIERTSTQMLTAPVYSPDGTEFAYLRLPLLTQEDKTRIDEFVKKRTEIWEHADPGSTAENWIYVTPKTSTPTFPQDDNGDVLKNWTDLTLPPAPVLEEFRLVYGGGLIAAELVVRAVSTGELVRSIPLNVPQVQSDVPPNVQGVYTSSYLLTRLQYSPDGAWLY